MYIVQLVVQPAGIADGIAAAVTTPEGSGGGPTIGANKILTTRLLLLAVDRACVCPSCTGAGTVPCTCRRFANVRLVVREGCC
jgi:hypothetical protein